MFKKTKTEKKETTEKTTYSRRDFLAKGAAIISAGTIASVGIDSCASTPVKAENKTENAENTKGKFPLSNGYLVYDSDKCIGCTTCMLSCSMVHYGEQSLSLARIQVIQDSFGKYPDDLQTAVCRQCPAAPCVANCPAEAAYIDAKNGNIRRIDEEKCIGCGACLEACPYQPHRPVWNHIKNKSSKCDLCLDTPYWNEKGGVEGKQACVEACPMQAIKVVTELPDQKSGEGYNVNLRNNYWHFLRLNQKRS